jgi:dephospho-CoA kinase
MTEQKQSGALALVGMPGAGKTLCAKHLEERGFFQFRFGGIVTGEVSRRGLAINAENERVVREEFRRNEGMDAIAKRALPHLKTALETHNNIIIDGLYGFSEYKMLRSELGAELIVVAIVCSRGVRHRRLTTRVDRPLTVNEAENRDYREIENLEKGGPIAIADYFLDNDDTAESLLTRLDVLLDKLRVMP